VKAYLVDGADEIRPEWLSGKQHVGVTAGASAPEVLVRQVVDRLTEMGARSVIQLDGNPEHVVFPLPRELQRSSE
ncbi:MAG: 4-hydroxy-3-methylbut-2-enyl diphosphate reductase, partial [Rhodocyclaceae bacterium]|nr:4-hydroxy-3-methylbut-2-enyl diphosphate reductase [Rhodocyclaceae bacterium]